MPCSVSEPEIMKGKVERKRLKTDKKGKHEVIGSGKVTLELLKYSNLVIQGSVPRLRETGLRGQRRPRPGIHAT